MTASRKSWLTVLILVTLAVTVAYTQSQGPGARDERGRVMKNDNRPDPLTTRQLELRQKALDAKLNGKSHGPRHEVARGQFVELAREGEGAVWTVLGEFSDYPHNSMPRPDRTVDNTTIWVPDFNRQHYADILFDEAPGANSMRNFYIEQSSNRYTVHGDVTDWVMVDDHLKYDDDPDQQVWDFLQDTVNAWYDAQVAAGKTPAQIDEYLTQFDKWDRYDYDGDGDFDEPDGYIDTFQSVHSGQGEEAGGGALGTEAIWSHSWYAHYELIGSAGPSFNKFGGVQIGNSSYWVGKYTIQPEDGSVGVFAHEFGHDLGLPDLYDYYSNYGNGTGFWTLMADGSWLDDGKDTIGAKSSHMGAWEKFQLGWLNYEVAYAGKLSSHKLGPMESNTKQAQGLFVVLPKKAIQSDIGAPFAGSYFYFSGAADNLNTYMFKAFSLPEAATVTAKVNYDIELDWDYAYLVYSVNNGASWTPVATNLSTSTDPNGQNAGHGITGSSGGNWIDLTATLPVSGNVLLGFRYWTDGAVTGGGFKLDELNVTGSTTDGAEANAGWTFQPATGGFHVSNGTETKLFNQYYVAEFRQYWGYDRTLKVGPYYFGYLNDPARENYVDHFPYQDGLLINYWDTSQRDNNTGLHPGHGLLLPVDAHPKTLLRSDGSRWGNRIQTYDSTFGLEPTDGIPNIHRNSVPQPIPSLPAVPVFDDRYSWYDGTNPTGSVITPNTKTQVRVLSISALGAFMQVEVRPAK